MEYFFRLKFRTEAMLARREQERTQNRAKETNVPLDTDNDDLVDRMTQMALGKESADGTDFAFSVFGPARRGPTSLDFCTAIQSTSKYIRNHNRTRNMIIYGVINYPAALDLEFPISHWILPVTPDFKIMLKCWADMGPSLNSG